jgi:hypothetical protein
MKRAVLAQLTSYSESNTRYNKVYLGLRGCRGNGRYNRGITVYGTSPEQLLLFLIQALKTAGYQGSWRVEDPSLTTQFVATVKSFDPIPKKPCCPKCQKPLLIGDEVVSVETQHRSRVYHIGCYESTLH